MAQAKKKTSTKSSKAVRTTAKKSCSRGDSCYKKCKSSKDSNMFFVICMSILAATLLFADLIMITA